MLNDDILQSESSFDPHKEYITAYVHHVACHPGTAGEAEELLWNADSLSAECEDVGELLNSDHVGGRLRGLSGDVLSHSDFALLRFSRDKAVTQEHK